MQGRKKVEEVYIIYKPYLYDTLAKKVKQIMLFCIAI
jgi:hypothetical protein